MRNQKQHGLYKRTDEPQLRFPDVKRRIQWNVCSRSAGEYWCMGPTSGGQSCCLREGMFFFFFCIKSCRSHCIHAGVRRICPRTILSANDDVGGAGDAALKDTDEAIPVSNTVRFFAPCGQHFQEAMCLQSTPTEDATTSMSLLYGQSLKWTFYFQPVLPKWNILFKYSYSVFILCGR